MKGGVGVGGGERVRGGSFGRWGGDVVATGLTQRLVAGEACGEWLGGTSWKADVEGAWRERGRSSLRLRASFLLRSGM